MSEGLRSPLKLKRHKFHTDSFRKFQIKPAELSKLVGPLHFRQGLLDKTTALRPLYQLHAAATGPGGVQDFLSLTSQAHCISSRLPFPSARYMGVALLFLFGVTASV